MTRITYSARSPETKRKDDWRMRAACLGRWAEMHPDNDEQAIADAKSICAPCPVRVDCLWDAILTDDMKHGIRAGLRASERRAVAKELELRRQGVQTSKRSA